MAEDVREQSWMTWVLWAGLLAAVIWGLFVGSWRLSLIAALTLVLSFLPLVFQRFAEFRLPRVIVFSITLFAICTLVLGETMDFYQTYWWWDIALHAGSAIMFGLFGVVLVMMVFQGAELQASPGMVAFFAFCFAAMVGVVWEIFEFAMDQIFGLNMQKSGLIDTMWDLIVDCLGGIAGALAGYAYLRGATKGMAKVLDEAVSHNREHFHDAGLGKPDTA